MGKLNIVLHELIEYSVVLQLLAVEGSILRDALIHKKIIAKGEEVRTQTGDLRAQGVQPGWRCALGSRAGTTQLASRWPREVVGAEVPQPDVGLGGSGRKLSRDLLEGTREI